MAPRPAIPAHRRPPRDPIAVFIVVMAVFAGVLAAALVYFIQQ